MCGEMRLFLDSLASLQHQRKGSGAMGALKVSRSRPWPPMQKCSSGMQRPCPTHCTDQQQVVLMCWKLARLHVLKQDISHSSAHSYQQLIVSSVGPILMQEISCVTRLSPWQTMNWCNPEGLAVLAGQGGWCIHECGRRRPWIWRP